MADFIQEYKGAMPSEMCDLIVKFMDKELEEKKNTAKHDTEIRKCDQLYVPIPDHNESQLIYALIKACCDKAFSTYKMDMKDPVNGLSIASRMEQPSILKYRHDVESHFNEHADNWNDASAARQISVIIYLNDVKEGGETTFTLYKKDIIPEKGKIVFFPSFFTYPHIGKQPKSNDKYIVVTWYCLDGTTPFYRRM